MQHRHFLKQTLWLALSLVSISLWASNDIVFKKDRQEEKNLFWKDVIVTAIKLNLDTKKKYVDFAKKCISNTAKYRIQDTSEDDQDNNLKKSLYRCLKELEYHASLHINLLVADYLRKETNISNELIRSIGSIIGPFIYFLSPEKKQDIVKLYKEYIRKSHGAQEQQIIQTRNPGLTCFPAW